MKLTSRLTENTLEIFDEAISMTMHEEDNNSFESLTLMRNELLTMVVQPLFNSNDNVFNDTQDVGWIKVLRINQPVIKRNDMSVVVKQAISILQMACYYKYKENSVITASAESSFEAINGSIYE